MEYTEILHAPWMLDVLVGSVLLACACVRGAKGIYDILMPLAVTAAAVVCALFVSAILAGPVTEAVFPAVEDKVIPAIHLDHVPEEVLSTIVDAVTDTEGMVEQVEAFLPDNFFPTVSRLGLDLEDFLRESLEKIKAADTSQVQELFNERQIQKLKEVGVEVKSAADAALEATDTALEATKSAMNVEALVYSAVLSLMHRLTFVAVHILLWCVFCVIFLVTFTIIKNTFGLTFDLPVIKWVDRLGGAALGIVECSIVLFVIGWILNFIGFTALAELSKGTVLFGLYF